MTLVATVLGCGSSAGVPRVAGGWGACDPANPKNRRRRCSLLVERRGPAGTTRILVDTSPDLREQLLSVEVDRLDAVLLTHDHADHTHGIDDLRPLAIHRRARIPVYMDGRTAGIVRERFGYAFETPQGSPYPPILEDCRIAPPEQFVISGQGGEVVVQPYEQTHGDIVALGFRIGGLAYSCDASDFPPQSLPHLRDLDIWIVDALRYTPHISHLTVDEALEWIARMAPRRAVLTDLHVDLDYQTLRAQLPANVEPAYDGMRIELPYDA